MSGLSSVFSMGRWNWATALGHCHCHDRPSPPSPVCSGSLRMALQEPPLMSFPWEGRGMTLFWL